MLLIDTHAHMHDNAFAQDLPAVLERARRAGVETILCIGIDVPSSRRCVELARQAPDLLRAAVGIHPTRCGNAATQQWACIEELARQECVVAIGETGMDLYHDFTAPDVQRQAFLRHLRLARSVDKPIIIHSRKADADVLTALDEACPGGVRGVRHCFDRSAEAAQSYLARGLHVSLAAAVTRDGYKRLKSAVAEIPPDRLLVETDCPYQPPAARAGQRNEPAFIVETVRAVAELRSGTPERVACLTTANARELFGL